MAIYFLSPMLETEDMDASILYYETVLGFTCVNRMASDWACVERDKVSLMFTQRYSQKKHPRLAFTGSLYLYTHEVDDMWEELQDKVNLAYPLETFAYGMREFGFYDCHGYLIQFGSPQE